MRLHQAHGMLTAAAAICQANITVPGYEVTTALDMGPVVTDDGAAELEYEESLNFASVTEYLHGLLELVKRGAKNPAMESRLYNVELRPGPRHSCFRLAISHEHGSAETPSETSVLEQEFSVRPDGDMADSFRLDIGREVARAVTSAIHTHAGTPAEPEPEGEPYPPIPGKVRRAW